MRIIYHMLPEEEATRVIEHKLKNGILEKKGPHYFIETNRFEEFKRNFTSVNLCTCDFVKKGQKAQYVTDVVFYECDECNKDSRAFSPRNKTEYVFTFTLR